MQRCSPKLSVGCSRIPRSGELWGDRVVSVSLVTLALPLIRGFSLVFFARSPRHRLSVRMASNFRAHGNLFLCAQKDISVRTKISRLPHSALTPCPEDIIFLASQPNFRAEGREFLWVKNQSWRASGGRRRASSSGRSALMRRMALALERSVLRVRSSASAISPARSRPSR